MSVYALTPLAKVDIFEIWSHIADDSEDVANCPLRFWTLTRYPNYTVVYRPGTAPVQVIAVVRGKRNVRRILKQRP